jgi:type I restriction enzyme S subunit
MRDNKLPKGWALATLRDAGTWTSGGTPSRSHPDYFNGHIPWVKTGDLNDGPIDSIPEKITQKGLENSSAKLFPIGTLLMAMYGATIGKLGILKIDAATNQACAALLSFGKTKDIIPYTFYYLMYERHSFKQIGQGDAQPNISQTIIKKHPLILAPLPEQHRIVEALESYFSRLDEAVMLLERVQRNLKRYRASVLKAAVEGRLVPTEAELARKDKRDFEPASELLKRILTERRKKWEETELAKMRAKGVAPKDGSWKAKYKEPAAPDTSGLPELPDGWCWATVAQLGETVTGTTPSTKQPEYYGEEVPFFKPTDLDVGYYVSKARQYLTRLGASQARVLPSDSVLVTCIGATIGKTGLARVDCTTNQQINAFIPETSIRPEHYTFWYFTSSAGQRAIIDNSSSTTLPIINKSRFERLFIPLPPIMEQRRIVDEIERMLSLEESFISTMAQAIHRCTRLRQSILKWAFEGKLADQDPNDEPASVLLERIRNLKGMCTHV